MEEQYKMGPKKTQKRIPIKQKKRKPSSYHQFRRAFNDFFRERNPRERMQQLSEDWKNLSNEDKQRCDTIIGASLLVREKYQPPDQEPSSSPRNEEVPDLSIPGTVTVGAADTNPPSLAGPSRNGPSRNGPNRNDESPDTRFHLSDEQRTHFIQLGYTEEEMLRIEGEILQFNPRVKWQEVKNLEKMKRRIYEATVLPLQIPSYFRGIRTPYKGILLFGPPGTGKTLSVRAVVTETEMLCFSIKGTSIASPFKGVSERLMRLLFEIAKFLGPSIIFIDEVDALCSPRGSPDESESSRRVLSEMLVQMDGIESGASSPHRVLVLAACNRPWDLDMALIRRFEKRLHVPMPDEVAILEMMTDHLAICDIAPDVDMSGIARSLDGFSGDDVKNFCREVAFMAMREKLDSLKSFTEIPQLTSRDIEGQVTVNHFQKAKQNVKASVTRQMIQRNQDWKDNFGSE